MNEQNALSTIFKDSLVPSVLTQNMREAGITTVRKSVECRSLPSVSKVVETVGYRETAAAIVLQIERLGMMLNVSKPMAPEAVAETAKMVVDGCTSAGVNITFADIDIVFQRAMRGGYGKFYGGFGCADILGWFNGYISEKAEEYVQYNIEKSQQLDSGGERSYDRAKAKDREAHQVAAEYYRMTSKDKNNEQNKEN